MKLSCLKTLWAVAGLGIASPALAQSNVQITGGTIDNTVIGGNTPSTGVFSQLSVNIPNAGTGQSNNVGLGITIGSPTGATKDLIGFAAGVTQNGSGQSFASNPQVSFDEYATGFGAVEEIDGNNFSDTIPCEPLTPKSGCSAADGLRITGSSGHYTGSAIGSDDPMSRAIFITGDGSRLQWYDGIDFTGPAVKDINILFGNNATDTILDQGNHQLGIDLEATYAKYALAVHGSQFTIDNSGNMASTGSISGGKVVSAGAVTLGDPGLGNQEVDVFGYSSASSFQLSQNGAAVGAGNTIGNPTYSGALDGIVNCTDHASSQTWEIAANFVNATYLGGYVRSVISSGAATAYWGISTSYATGSGYASPTITVTNSHGGSLYCSGLIKVIRQP